MGLAATDVDQMDDLDTATWRDDAFPGRRPPRSSPCHSYWMPLAGRLTASAARPNCGWRREPGYRRMSISVVTPARSRTSTSASADRAPCPTVSTTATAAAYDRS